MWKVEGEQTAAVVCSDLHLRDAAPVARDAPDWLAAQQVYLDQLATLCVTHQAPLVVAGDVFDRWRPGPGTIAQAITWAARMQDQTGHQVYAVPGQHDLPHHQYEERHRTGYGCLVAADVLTDLPAGQRVPVNGVWLVGWPWGAKPKRLRTKDSPLVAICHAYIWTDKRTTYPGSDLTKKVAGYAPALRGYTAAFFGDNHIPFRARGGGCTIINCGNGQPLTRAEQSRPSYAYLLSNLGNVQRVALDNSADRWTPAAATTVAGKSTGAAADVLAGLAGLGPDVLDYRVYMSRHLDEIEASPTVRAMVSRAMDGEVGSATQPNP